MPGIIGYGSYLPRARLARSAIGETLGQRAGAGTRSVASYDEDSTTMGVEAARAALRSAAFDLDSLLFSTAAPVYQDKTNANAIHAALRLDASVPSFDFTGSVRSGVGALRTALGGSATSMVVLSDIRTGLPGSEDERDGGDGAAALVVGDGSDTCPVLAEFIGAASITNEFLDRWRAPGEPVSQVWEPRFGSQAYAGLAEQAFEDALKAAACSVHDVDHLIVAGTRTQTVRKSLGARLAPDASLADDRVSTLGNTGTAQPGLLLASVLDAAEPHQIIALVVLADGVETLLFRTTESLQAYRGKTAVPAVEVGADGDIPYPTFLTWRGMLRREPARRPDPDRPGAPAAWRSEGWKFGFVGTRCTSCETRHLPPQRVCRSCGTTDAMTPEPLADVGAIIATFTIDHLALSLNPPVVVVVIDFDGGGRFQCEMSDVDPAEVAIGGRVEMSFRRIFTAGGIHNYFWKARPVRSLESTAG